MDLHHDALRSAIGRFVKLDDADWDLLTPHLQTRVMSKHDLFAAEGKRASDVSFVVSGTFRQYYFKDGEERTTYFYFDRDIMCSYISCITGKPSLLSIQALSDATILVFPYSVLSQLYKTNHNWQTFGRLVAEYIAIGLEERMVSLLIQSPEERYRDLLSGARRRIIEQIPQQYIANYLGITPVSMSRIRKRIMPQ